MNYKVIRIYRYERAMEGISVVVDPVCGMNVDPKKTPYKTLYKGKIYYFCSQHCKRMFEENPELYLSRGPQIEM